MNQKRWLAFAALALIWGSTWIAADQLQLPPLLSSALRFLLAALWLLPLILRKRCALPRGRALGYLVLLSVTMMVVPLLLLLWARQQLPSATVVVSFATMPLMVLFFFSHTPAGLVIYWVMSNLFTICQQYVIMHRYGVENPIDQALARLRGGRTTLPAKT